MRFLLGERRSGTSVTTTLDTLPLLPRRAFEFEFEGASASAGASAGVVACSARVALPRAEECVTSTLLSSYMTGAEKNNLSGRELCVGLYRTCCEMHVLLDL